MKILCADKLSEEAIAPLVQAGHDVIVEPQTTAESLVARLASEDFEVLVVRSTKVSSAALGANPALGLVVRAGAGTDNIDKQAASARGIYVSNVPGQNAIAVAELAMGLMLSADRHIAECVADLRSEKWDKGTYSKADGIFGKKLAIIGLGDIGLALARRAHAFGMKIGVLDKPGRDPETLASIQALDIELAPNIETLLGDADIVSLHVPSATGTKGLVDDAFLGLMKDGSMLVNTSRGDVVDPEALIQAMDSRGIKAGLDVWPDEPSQSSGDWISTLAKHSNVVGTHHIGASTAQAQNAVATGTVAVVEAYLAGRVVNCVNLSTEPVGSFVLTVRHFDKVGVLARVFEALRRSGLNVQQMQNHIFSGPGAAVASIHLLADPGDEVMGILRADADVLAVSLLQSPTTMH